jgi:DNA-binding response OmpR family regulator
MATRLRDLDIELITPSPQVTQALGLDTTPVEVGPLVLWPAERQCFAAGERVQLSRREFDVLLALASGAGHVVARERLHELIWHGHTSATHRDVDVHVRKLRNKLLLAAPAWTFIHTHRQVGYRLWSERADRA